MFCILLPSCSTLVQRMGTVHVFQNSSAVEWIKGIIQHHNLVYYSAHDADLKINMATNFEKLKDTPPRKTKILINPNYLSECN